MKGWMFGFLSLVMFVSACTNIADQNECSTHNFQNCPEDICKIGPSCPACQDIGCHPIGYDEDWVIDENSNETIPINTTSAYSINYALKHLEALEDQTIVIRGYAMHPIPDGTPEGTGSATYLIIVNESLSKQPFIDQDKADFLRILATEYKGKTIHCTNKCYPLKIRNEYFVKGSLIKGEYGDYVLKLEDFKPIEKERSEERCANYQRCSTTLEICATCGDGVCDEFEKCTSSSVTCPDEDGLSLATSDCGRLYCPEDC